MRDHRQVFEEIYQKEIWGHGKGSGTGSDPDYCQKYIEKLKTFVVENRVRSVLDLGCGDRQVYRDLNWAELDVRYLGVDTVAEVEPDAVVDFSKPGRLASLFQDYGHWDLVLLKDVLMHWSNDEVCDFLSRLVRQDFSHCWAANSYKYFRKPELNDHPRTLDPRYSWAPIDLTREPFKRFGFENLFRYRFKQVCYLRGPSHAE